ncbi:hypothetical protein [Jeotgalibacillus marinus]|uniref:Uncharacterized protein n=1 Tax=Jeotgalibacillus marinus TaxID=86667 RepID=A0ABV3Q191_9BACL
MNKKNMWKAYITVPLGGFIGIMIPIFFFHVILSDELTFNMIVIYIFLYLYGIIITLRHVYWHVYKKEMSDKSKIKEMVVWGLLFVAFISIWIFNK